MAAMTPQRWQRLFVRVILLIGAVVFLWLAGRQYFTSRESSSVDLRFDEFLWYTALLCVMAAVFCFTVAAFLPTGRITLRPLPALAFAVVPILGIAHLSAWLHFWWGWSVPVAIGPLYFRWYMAGEIQTVLAALVGLALASAIRSAEDAPVLSDGSGPQAT
jgi:hypothetical protein